jgi:hypothetical protein
MTHLLRVPSPDYGRGAVAAGAPKYIVDVIRTGALPPPAITHMLRLLAASAEQLMAATTAVPAFQARPALKLLLL